MKEKQNDAILYVPATVAVLHAPKYFPRGDQFGPVRAVRVDATDLAFVFCLRVDLDNVHGVDGQERGVADAIKKAGCGREDRIRVLAILSRQMSSHYLE